MAALSSLNSETCTTASEMVTYAYKGSGVGAKSYMPANGHPISALNLGCVCHCPHGALDKIRLPASCWVNQGAMKPEDSIRLSSDGGVRQLCALRELTASACML